MPTKNKSSLEQLIKKADAFDYQNILVDRKLSASSKKSKLSDFFKTVEKTVANERDILLIAIQLR